uniref:Uncharacterized protein n=1 Tax=Anguilla anguilla TaxID=7936 RepID=A0A0E9T946_ANGAN
MSGDALVANKMAEVQQASYGTEE